MDFEFYDRLKEIEKGFSKQINEQVEAEIGRRTFKLTAILSSLALVLGVLGYSTWQEIPRIAKDTATETIQSETSLVVLEELKAKEEAISVAYTKVHALLTGLEDNYSSIESSISSKLKSDSEFLKLTKGVKGDQGERGIPGDAGEKGEKGDKGESGFPNQFVYGSISPSGQILSGDRFSVLRSDIGRYQITFSNVFSKPPLIIAMAESARNFDAGVVISIKNDSKSKSGFSMQTLLSQNNNWVDTSWQFIAFVE